MEMESRVRDVVESFLSARPSFFLVDVSVSEGNHIRVVIDSDKYVTLQDCIDLNRLIESNLNEIENVNFSLEVMSAGVTQPLSLRRQYVKNCGRDLEVITTDGKSYVGTISNAEQDYIKLRYKIREPKPVGKGKITVEKEQNIKYNEIKQANLKVMFKTK